VRAPRAVIDGLVATIDNAKGFPKLHFAAPYQKAGESEWSLVYNEGTKPFADAAGLAPIPA